MSTKDKVEFFSLLLLDIFPENEAMIVLTALPWRSAIR
jgi:hypothetical protein